MQRPVRDSLKSEQGGINYVKILFFGGLLAIGYFGYVYVPLWLDDWGVKKAIRTACNASYADRRVETIIKILTNGVNEEHMDDVVIARDGSVMHKPLEFTSENYIAGLTTSPPACNVEVNYERHVVWPFTKKERVVRFHHKHSEDLSEIKY